MNNNAYFSGSQSKIPQANPLMISSVVANVSSNAKGYIIDSPSKQKATFLGEQIRQSH